MGEGKDTVEGLTRSNEVVGSRVLIERDRGGRGGPASVAISVLASTSVSSATWGGSFSCPS